MNRWFLSLGLALAPLFLVTINPAALAASLSLSSTAPRQGETIEVTVIGADSSGTVPGVKFLDNEYKLFPTGEQGKYVCLIGIPADLEPGSYKIHAGSEAANLRVLMGKFPLQYLRLPPAKDNFKMSPGEEETVDAAKAQVSDTRMWHGPFVRPSKYRISSAFGLKRKVNGRLLKDYFHSGLDFAAPAGTPVVSTSDGVVIFAMKGWRLHGNCVAIDHGQGVVSFYLHLSSIAVKKGQHVASGEKIGTIGSTGRATGPHLHFSVYVNKNATNPMDWFAHAF